MSFAGCATAASTNSDWFVRSWQTDNGLPHNTINGIVQTSDGYLWMGTPSGLVNFDGAQFQKFELTNSIFGGNRGVVSMIRGANGGLWLAMNRGAVAYLNGSGTKVFTAADGLVDAQVHELAEAADGTLWVSFIGGQGRCIKDGKVMGLPSDKNLPNLFSMVSDAKGDIWAVAGSGELVVYRAGKIHRLARLADTTAQLAAAKSDGIWACAGAHLLRIYADGRSKSCGDFNADRCTALMEDSQGAVWIGTAFDGLIRYDGSKFETISTTRPGIKSLLEDREGDIWAGTIGGGLNRISRLVVQVQGTESGLPIETVRSLCEDARGIWAVTENGMLARYSNEGWQTVSTNKNWKQYNLICVTSDNNGGLWLGTRNRKLLHWHEGENAPEEIVVPGSIYSLLASTNDDVWMGEIGGTHLLQHLHDGKLTTHRFPADVRTIRAAVQDANGIIWFASARGDLLRVQGDEVVKEPLPESNAGLSIRCLAATADGALWIGYEELGLGWLKNGRYHRITTAQGLFDNYISQIVADDDGWLWFGSDHGIFKAREKDIEDVADGKLSRVDCVHYGPGDGAANLQANFGSAPGALRSRDGKIWIPTRSGLAVVNPALNQNNTHQLPVILTQVIVDQQTIARRNTIADDASGNRAAFNLSAKKIELQLPPDYRRLRIEFTALGFTGVDNIRFRYRLVGFDSDWQETAGEQRYATYSRLPAGDYTFEVMACNAEGIWNTTRSWITFIVLPFFWDTWWFKILAGFLLLAAVVGSVRYFEAKRTQRRLARLEYEHAIERERARIARDLHDDLGGSLTKVVLLSELALKRRNDPAKAGESVETISKTVRSAIQSLDETVWAISPRNDTLPHLIDYIGQSAVEFLNAAGINGRVDLVDSLPQLPVSAKVRHNVFLAVKEVLTNIARHADATEVRLRTTVDKRKIAINIEDNGRGFAQSPENAFADGLRNLRQRMMDIGGECDVQSAPGAGTKVLLKFPAGHNGQ